MSVHIGDADGMVTGATQNYAESVRPVLQIIGRSSRGVSSGLIILVLKEKVLFFADTTLNVNPSAEELASIAVHASEVVQYFNIDPRIAMLSFSNFAGKFESPAKMQKAAQIVRDRFPNLIVDGEMQADTAINPSIVQEIFPFCELKKGANILIFPNLDSSNITYKLVNQLAGGEILGPFLMGVRRPANVLQRSCGVNDIVNTTALTALQVQAIRDFKAIR
jgi:malate dehydrogenase (oxaloacetate-decarboxylating)(NADP+)